MLNRRIEFPVLPALIILSLIFVVLMACKTTGLSKAEQMKQFEKMSWLAGAWQGHDSDFFISEYWIKKSDTLFTANSFLLMGVDTMFKESIRLEPGKRHIYMRTVFKNEGNTENLSYILIKDKAKSLVFEDRSQESVHKVIYTRVGDDKLRIFTEETIKGETIKESYILTKMR